MVNVKNANAMAEVLYYLKGIKQEDINKIPKKLLQYLNDNASKDYKCDFDFNKPLKELSLLDETRGIIGMICYNYWCVDEDKKKQYLDKLNLNEQKYQEELHEKYSPDNLFKGTKNSIETIDNSNTILEYKESFFTKIKKWFKRFV